MRDTLLDSDLIYGDETPFQVLKELERPAQTKNYLWAQLNGAGPPVRLFFYSPGRGANQAHELYAGIKPGAVLMTDGYELYGGIAHGHQLVHLGCWAHVRRGFIKAEQAAPKAARTIQYASVDPHPNYHERAPAHRCAIEHVEPCVAMLTGPVAQAGALRPKRQLAHKQQFFAIIRSVHGS